jgi:hypothetical protein
MCADKGAPERKAQQGGVWWQHSTLVGCLSLNCQQAGWSRELHEHLDTHAVESPDATFSTQPRAIGWFSATPSTANLNHASQGRRDSMIRAPKAINSNCI